MQKSVRCFLIGNPNSGKSSLFNQLTGIYQKIANYPGVTTEKKLGSMVLENTDFSILDLPGCYSLYPNSIDERVVIDELLSQKPDLLIFVADACHLHRSLLLYTQIADLKIPIVVVVNMLDELHKNGEEIDISFLEKELETKIIECNSKTGKGVLELKKYLMAQEFNTTKSLFGNKTLFEDYINANNFSYREWHQFVNSSEQNAIVENIKRKEIIDRYNKIEKIINLTVRKTELAFKRKRITDILDKYLMHPRWGYLFVIMILFVVFQVLFTLAAYPMDWLDQWFAWISERVNAMDTSSIFVKFIAEAVLPGIAGVLIFIPQIALLFVFNTVLEESGYTARMVFLLDRWMRKFGMSGKSILPLMSGNACAIPAIASTKAIPTHKERLITILSIPFMTCSARLPVYTLLISIVIPTQYRALSLLLLYMIGVLFAMLFGWVANQCIKTNEKSFLIMEMPPYRFPSFKNIVLNIKNSVVPFVKVAGKFILSISIVLWFLASFGWNSAHSKFEKTDIEHSVAANLGKTIEPVIRPLGYDWKIGVALVTSFAAREVFVSTLATLYKIDTTTEDETLFSKMKSQVNTYTGKPVFNLASGISLLLFYAFALQCMSTLAAIRKETDSWKYPMYSFTIMAVLAYVSAFIAYQLLK